MAKDLVEIKFPPGRLVGGSLYDPKTEDMEGRPLVFKQGADAGKPRVEYYLALAIAKNPNGQHWAHEAEWGAILWAAGHRQSARAGEIKSFAWKITDGDSTDANSKGNRPCDNEGWPGHWILHMASSFAPRALRLEGDRVVDFIGVDAIMPGDFVEIFGSVGPNGSELKPGVYINHSAVCFLAYSDKGRIQFGTNPNGMGFGKAALPAGATSTPAGAANLPASSPPPAPGAVGGATPPQPPSPPATGAPPPSAATAAPAPSTPVAPAPEMRGAAPPPPAPAPAGPRMTAKAEYTYQQYKDSGWTDESLRQHGLME